jgi:hypothetical protein
MPEVDAMAMGEKKGSKWIKVVGIAALVGVAIAVGRIVLRVFSEKSGAGETQEGV